MSKKKVELPRITLRDTKGRVHALKQSYTLSSTYEYAGQMLVQNGRTLRLTRGAKEYLRRCNF